jgi:hypothetical protein
LEEASSDDVTCCFVNLKMFMIGVDWEAEFDVETVHIIKYDNRYNCHCIVHFEAPSLHSPRGTVSVYAFTWYCLCVCLYMALSLSTALSRSIPQMRHGEQTDDPQPTAACR